MCIHSTGEGLLWSAMEIKEKKATVSRREYDSVQAPPYLSSTAQADRRG
jgi:hypothetical protein